MISEGSLDGEVPIFQTLEVYVVSPIYRQIKINYSIPVSTAYVFSGIFNRSKLVRLWPQEKGEERQQEIKVVCQQWLARGSRNFMSPHAFFDLQASDSWSLTYLISMVIWSVLGIEKSSVHTTSFPQLTILVTE